MSKLTGLPIRSTPHMQIVNRSEMRQYIVENLHAEMTPAEFHIQEATLRAFGLVSREFNLQEFLINFYTEQAAGFYDPRRKTMFIADWPAPDFQQMVLTHELTHALQDQSFDLEKFLHANRDDDDATSARQAVVEGHATAAMMQAMVGHLDLDLASLPSLEPLMAQVIHQQYEEFPAFSKAPFFFRFQALFPYVEGMGFMQRGLKLGGWNRLNSLFADPPSATKEIFEPRVYFDKQPLQKLALPHPGPLSGVRGLQLLTENILGELGYYSLLAQFISEEVAKTVGEEWVADRYLLYETSGSEPALKGQDYALVARTLWSGTESALAFFRDYHTILARKYPELAPDRRSTADLFIGTTSHGQVILLRRGAECLWAEGVPAAQTDTMLGWLRSL